MFKKVLFFLCFSVSMQVFAQNVILSGQILDESGKTAIENAKISLKNTNLTTVTDKQGAFKLENVPAGKYQMDVTTSEGSIFNREVELHESNLDLGTVKSHAPEQIAAVQNADAIPTVSVSDDDNKDDGGQNVAGVLSASRDVFVSAASFTFFPARWRFRGYASENSIMYMNGVPMNNLEDGYSGWSDFSGLNDVMRSRDNSIGLDPTTFTYGGVGGGVNIDSRAGSQRKGLSVSYAISNRTYMHRLMATYNSGLLKHGWAISVAASRRWAQKGYVPGTWFDGYSYFFSVEKQIGQKNSLAFTAFGAPNKQGRSTPATQEMYDLTGSNYYNPNWGYQEGKIRNARVRNTHQPMFILTHEAKFNNKSSLITAASFQFGRNGQTGLDWFNAPDPRPDYYRYLPSYQDEDSMMRLMVAERFRQDVNQRQVNWGRLYEVNQHSLETVKDVDGIAGNNVTGLRSHYIIQEVRTDIKKFNFNTVYSNAISNLFNLTAGLSYQWQQSHNYKTVNDLLGGDFYVDVNQFAERDFPDSTSAGQNDLSRPNRLLKVGDKFGYDYNIVNHKGSGWLQGMFTTNKVDFFLAAELSANAYWRHGNVTNGLFPDNSYGDSKKMLFINYAFKAGLTYKINGRNFLFANGAYLTRSPFFDDVFLSARTRNSIANNVKNETVGSFEGGYLLKAPRIKARAVFFFTQFMNQTKTMTFYDDAVQNLVNYTLTNIDTRHLGVELAVDGKIYQGFGASAVASLGRYYYTDRPLATITQDNSSQILKENEIIYAKNFWVANAGPQVATTFGLNYRSPKFWFVNVNFNYYDRIWVDFNPTRRTSDAIDLVPYKSGNWNNIVDQERLKGQFTMDVFAGYSWKINNALKMVKKPMFLNLNVGVNNVTNNQNFRTGGFEQLRFDFSEHNPEKFPRKYNYAMGINFFISATFRM